MVALSDVFICPPTGGRRIESPGSGEEGPHVCPTLEVNPECSTKLGQDLPEMENPCVFPFGDYILGCGQ